MFGKLVKYELRYLIRTFAPIWAAVTALCIMARISMGMNFETVIGNMVDWENGGTASMTFLMLAMLSMMTMMVIYVVSLIQRFYKGMYGDEGYLMFTLPVTTGQLINAKGVGAMVMLLGSVLVGTVGFFILVSYPQLWEEVVFFLPRIAEEIDVFYEVVIICAYGMLFMLVATLAGIYTVYLAISLGQLWRNHPVAGAVLAYYGVGLVWSVINMTGAAILGENYAVDFVNRMVENPFNEILLVLTFYMANALLHAAVSFIGTKLLLDRKLNLG